MTTPQAAFGPTLAFAEQTLTAVLHRHLAERQVVPETWYALRLINLRGPGVTRETLIRGLDRSRNVTVDPAKLLARLEEDGLIHGEAEILLTSEGEALFRSLLEYVTGPTARLLGQFDDADIETTVRTLRAITKRAEEEEELSRLGGGDHQDA
jgi:hypothetical protein